MSPRLFILLTLLIFSGDAARILCYYCFPFLSHNLVFRKLTNELLKRGHQVTVITTFPENRDRENLTEIDVSEVTEKYREDIVQDFIDINTNKFALLPILKRSTDMIETQLKADAVRNLLERREDYDLVIVEAAIDSLMVLSHLYKAPLVLFSSLGLSVYSAKIAGMPNHPLIYPTFINQKFLNLNWIEKLKELFVAYFLIKAYEHQDEYADEMLLRVFGDKVPPVSDLRKRVDMMLVNTHPIWDFNRPVPPNVVYLGGFHLEPPKPLPEDLQLYLNSSRNGVIYVSCGTVVNLELMHPGKLEVILDVFAKLPYDILMKWDSPEMVNRPSNVKISQWLPQTGVLNHPNVKLFITQGGLQSTDEAIVAGVPLIALPIFGDQAYNAEQYLNHKIGLKLNMDTMTATDLNGAISEIMRNRDWYRSNIFKLRTAMYDQPQKAMERAVFWTEYLIRNGGKMIRSPAANMSLFEYYQAKTKLLVSV